MSSLERLKLPDQKKHTDLRQIPSTKNKNDERKIETLKPLLARYLIFFNDLWFWFFENLEIYLA